MTLGNGLRMYCVLETLLGSTPLTLDQWRSFVAGFNDHLTLGLNESAAMNVPIGMTFDPPRTSDDGQDLIFAFEVSDAPAPATQPVTIATPELALMVAAAMTNLGYSVAYSDTPPYFSIIAAEGDTYVETAVGVMEANAIQMAAMGLDVEARAEFASDAVNALANKTQRYIAKRGGAVLSQVALLLPNYIPNIASELGMTNSEYALWAEAARVVVIGIGNYTQADAMALAWINAHWQAGE